MTQTPEAVIFDIGNVLITWNPERLYGELLPDPEEFKRFFDTVKPHEMNDAVDRGGPFRETIYGWAEKFPQYRDLIRLWYDRWIDMANPLIDESWDMLRTLRGNGVPVYALTNFGVESFDYAEGIYPQLKEFDRRYISGHMKVIKPETRIYEMVEEDCGLKGAQLFFTDDRVDNIDAANARGWQTHLFNGPSGLRASLEGCGLL